MLIINNESVLSNRQIKKEVQKAFDTMPAQVKRLLEHSELEIVYTSKSGEVVLDVDFYQEEITLENTLGLFDYAQNHVNSYRIYVCVDNHRESTYTTFETLMHELGHYVDYMVGYAIAFDISGYHHFSSSNKNKLFYQYSEDILEVLKLVSNGYYEVWDNKKTEQFAEFFALYCLGKVDDYTVTYGFSSYLHDSLDAALYNLDFFKNKEEAVVTFKYKLEKSLFDCSLFVESLYKKVFIMNV